MEVVFLLYNDDCIKIMDSINFESVDMIFADPPYFLSNGGKSISSGKIVSVDKGEWDKKQNYDDVNKFTKDWLTKCFYILKNNGSIWVTGTYHNIFDIKQTMDNIGFRIINIVIWEKKDPPPLIYKNKLRFSYEFIIWADKGCGHTYNYNEMYKIDNKELQDVWLLPSVQLIEKTYGYHPTQKPECLLERIILASTKQGQLILDPFMGSGTTGVVALKHGRKFIGIEKEKNFFMNAYNRIKNQMK